MGKSVHPPATATAFTEWFDRSDFHLRRYGWHVPPSSLGTCAAIVAHAAAVVLCHNHPSGDPTPSPDDRTVTEQLAAAGRLLDIPVHDHVIIGRGRHVSFAEAGFL